MTMTSKEKRLANTWNISACFCYI